MLYYSYFNTNSFFFTAFLLSGLLLGGSIQIFSNIIYYFKTKDKPKTKSINPINSRLFAVMPGRFQFNHKCLSFAIIIGLAVSTAVTLYSRLFIAKHSSDPTHTCDLVYNLLGLIIFMIYSKLILHIDLFLHHFLASGFIALGLIGIFYHTVSLDQLRDVILYDLLFIIVYSLPYVYLKYAMINKFMEPLSLAFYTGVVGLSMLLFVYLICRYCNLDYPYTQDILNVGESFIECFSRWDNIVVLFTTMIINAITIMATFSLIYNENPIVEHISFYSAGVFEAVYSWIVAFDYYTFLITFFGVICFVFGLLMYIELVVIHCCGIDHYSKIRIMKRGDLENDTLLKDYDILEFGIMESD